MKAIEGLESKKSSGHDGISNTLLKVIKANINQSLTHQLGPRYEGQLMSDGGA